MSFRLFIYYCALCGGWAAFAGWALGQALAPTSPLGRSAVLGCTLGLVLAFGLSLIDALWSLSWRQFGPLAARTLTALLVGALGGAAGGILGQLLVNSSSFFLILGWTILGIFIGAAIASFEVIAGGKERRAALGKMLKCIVGGSVGGILGGAVDLGLLAAFEKLFSNK